MSRIEDELSRRGFLKGVAGAVVTSQIEGFSGGAVASVTADAASSVNLRVTDSSLLLGNDEVELEIDRQTGFFQDIVNKHTGFHHKLEGTGVWPFGMCLGNAREPNLLRVEISNQPLSPQVMNYREIQGGDDPTGGQGKTLELRYDDLISTGGAMTGIQLAVLVTLKQGADYFLIRARVANGSKHGITNLYSGTGEFVADVSRDKETLAAPGWSCGTLWNNPHEFFVDRETFGYPMFGSQAGLAAGWLDLFGEKGGIGTAYLNRQGLSMYFKVQQEGKGLKINWQLFNLSHQKAVDRWTNVEGIYPLEPAKQFETDTWILAAHQGDWHRMADIYRTEYEQAFKGEYLTWNDTHEVARNLDVITNYTVLHVRDELGGKPTPPVRNKFSDVPP